MLIDIVLCYKIELLHYFCKLYFGRNLRSIFTCSWNRGSTEAVKRHAACILTGLHRIKHTADKICRSNRLNLGEFLEYPSPLYRLSNYNELLFILFCLSLTFPRYDWKDYLFRTFHPALLQGILGLRLNYLSC